MRKHEKHLSAGQRRPLTRANKTSKHNIKKTSNLFLNTPNNLSVRNTRKRRCCIELANLAKLATVPTCVFTQKLTFCLPNRILTYFKKIHNRSFHSCPFMHKEKCSFFPTHIIRPKCFRPYLYFTWKKKQSKIYRHDLVTWFFV